MSDRLCVVMPVYNEQEAIGPVLEKWDAALKALGIDYEIRPYNDGSRDASLAVMRQTARRLGPQICVRDKANGGHGHTILTGYREAAADGFDWIFQIDSDDEMGPEKFGELWSRRNGYDFLIGIRDGRKQALPRKIVSFVSRLCVRIFYGKSVWDVNAPYRLMRVAAFKDWYGRIPLTTFAPNVILSGLAARGSLRCFETRVPQHDRTTGEVSIKKWKLLKAAARSFAQTIVVGVQDASLRDVIRIVGFAAVSCFAVFSLVYGFYRGAFLGGDFQWGAVRDLLMRCNPYADTENLKHIEGAKVVANQLPSCLLLLAPFCIAPYKTSLVVWAISNLVFVALILYVVYRAWFKSGSETSDPCSFVVVLLLFFAGRSFCTLVSNGQHLLYSLALFMLAYISSEKERPFLSGILLACSAFKYTTIAPLAFVFIYKKAWKSIVTAVVIHVVLTLVASFLANESPFVLICQSLAIGNKLLGEGEADLASALVDVGASARSVAIASGIGYLVGAGLLLLALLGKRDCLLLKLSLFAVTGNMMFYHRAYDFVILLIPLIYILQKDISERKDLIAQAEKISTIINIVFWWFASRFFIFAGVRYAAIGFLIHLSLLAALFLENFNTPGKMSAK